MKYQICTENMSQNYMHTWYGANVIIQVMAVAASEWFSSGILSPDEEKKNVNNLFLIIL